MALRNALPISFTPTGVTDTLDGTNSPPGSMEALVNLIPDPTTLGNWICRPASELETSFSGFTTPGFISLLFVNGTYAYGLIASGLNAGKDQPFVYDLTAGAFVAVTGITGANTPTSPATSGDWVPPTAAQIGVYVIVTHPGFTGANRFGYFDITNPAAPVWNAGNTAVNALPAIPKSVAQFNGRAWYAVNNAVYFSDALVPLTITNATQILTLGDTQSVTALAGLPLNTQTGGIIQSLIAFKGASIMYQITGDSATSNLASNALDVATGTLAPNTICSTQRGLAFMAPSGLRIIDFNAQVSDPIGTGGTGVTIPFIFSNVPSRMAAAYGYNTYRITTQNAAALEFPWQEWWFDFVRGIWCGPHTFPASLIETLPDNSFLIAPTSVNAQLYIGMTVQNTLSSFTENGVQLEFEWLSSSLPDTQAMAENAMVETTINMSVVPGNSTISVTAVDENDAALDQASLTSSGSATIWNAFTWGIAVWRGTSIAFRPRQIKWTKPIVFRKMQIDVVGNSAIDFRIGTMYARYQQLGYLQQGD